MARHKRTRKPEQVGDVIGISHPKGRIPPATTDKGGHPRGIDVIPEPERAGIRDLEQGNHGATSIDMGAGGTGNAITRRRGTT
jgi:hypothetical protein